MAAPSTRNIIPLLEYGTAPVTRVPRSPGVDSGFGHFYWNDGDRTVDGWWPDTLPLHATEGRRKERDARASRVP